MKRKPHALTPGDTLGIIAPAGAVSDLARVADGKKALERLGFKVELGPNALKRNKYLAGTDKERTADLHRMFLDPGVNGIVCLRGGYGSLRILSELNYRLIRDNPKVLVGYSDITALQLAIWEKTGLVTFSGPMLISDFGDGPGAFTLKHFLKTLTTPSPLGIIPSAPGLKAETINKGHAGGRLIGGNLSLVVASLGTPYEIDTRGAILFLEEIGEEPYRVDRMLQQLLLAGKLHAAAGIVFGEFIWCEERENNHSCTVLEVIREKLTGLKKPCYYGLATGHGADKATLPLGVEAEIDAGQCQLTITESATIA